MFPVKVSVIVPVYNTEKYLRRCLDSLVNQTLSDIEIIIINDGSPDNSQLIIDEYCTNYPFVLGYRKDNGGLGSARNFGLQLAKGDYIGFVDSDDYVKYDMYEKMYNTAIGKNADLVICDFQFEDEEGNITDSSKITLELNDKQISESQYALKYGRSEAVNKLYSKSLFLQNKISYPGILYEDYPTTLLLIEAANQIAYVPEPMYFYVQRKNSIMGQSNSFSEKIFDILKATELIISSEHLFRDQADYKFYLDEIAPGYAFNRFFRNILFIKEKDFRKDVIKRWGSELNRILPGWYKSRSVTDLVKRIENPVKRLILNLIIYSFRTGITVISDGFFITNKFIKYYKNDN